MRPGGGRLQGPTAGQILRPNLRKHFSSCARPCMRHRSQPRRDPVSGRPRSRATNSPPTALPAHTNRTPEPHTRTANPNRKPEPHTGVQHQGRHRTASCANPQVMRKIIARPSSCNRLRTGTLYQADRQPDLEQAARLSPRGQYLSAGQATAVSNYPQTLAIRSARLVAFGPEPARSRHFATAYEIRAAVRRFSSSPPTARNPPTAHPHNSVAIRASGLK